MARMPDREYKSQDREARQYMDASFKGVKSWLWGFFYILQYLLWVVLELIKVLVTLVAQVSGGIAWVANAIAGTSTKISGAVDDTQRDVNNVLKEWKAREDLVAKEADKIRAQI